MHPVEQKMDLYELLLKLCRVVLSPAFIQKMPRDYVKALSCLSESGISFCVMLSIASVCRVVFRLLMMPNSLN